jgi:hypothetical protein
MMGSHAEGVSVAPKELERRVTKQRIDRSHRGVSVRQCSPPPWTRGEKAVLVLSTVILFVDIFLAVALFLP